MSSEPMLPVAAPSRRLRVAGIVGGVAAILIVAAGIATRAADNRQLRTWTDAQAEPTAQVSTPQRAANGATLQLPGRLEAFSRAPQFARVSGYLKSWRVDIGAHVKAGELMAEIETPDLDQQLLQARGDLASAQANSSLAESTAKRWQSMLASDSVSRQEVDERTADYTAKQALVQAAKANVDRLVATKGFARIVAPFDGVVTARETDVGALINAGSGTGSGPELFVVSDVNKLRVYVQVPQTYAPTIRPGATAQLSVPEYPGRSFPATVTALADSINAASGTTLVQLLVDNSTGKLLPGGFADVRFTLPVNQQALRVPASSLVFDQNGLRIATVGQDDRVTFKSVTISHDFGETVEIGSGLTPEDRIINNPPDGLNDGDRVRVAAAASNGAKPHA
ncbi:efflux RND transporter periplasmic adaptor subunit [Burkholderia sp. L27(2015)]|uniref:efflux RND transporter periplasmic adaptor subunit n=1 Tax=Burkholderia sp. L27(2015) TaxID=1641858 RepID=UPI00131B684F|nr:efflux RND transporter periplasmic adaptor subunit [Burkholderia sp. L27(2015)]